MTSPIELLSWDSRFFGRRIARFTKSGLTSALARAADQACAKHQVKCLYYLASADDFSSIRSAEAHGYHLMDIRVTLRLKRETADPFIADASPGTAYRAARAADIPLLRRLARTMFRNSRFALDPGFPGGAHEKLFAQWIAKSVRGHFDDWVGVADHGGRLAGFISCRKTGRAAGVIGLIGVSPQARRLGIGRGLLGQGWEWFRAHRISDVSVATQGRAIAAQRLYQDFGFKTSHVDLWYHKWY